MLSLKPHHPRKCFDKSTVSFFLIFSFTSASFLSGCIHNSAIHGPEVPKAIQTGKKENQEVLNEIMRFYYGRCIHDPTSPITVSSPPAANCGSPEEQRNTIIYDLKNIIDNNYEFYSRNLQQTADTTTFIGEVGAASLTAIGTLVGVGDLKDILSTASTLTQSTNVSIQKNFYQKQTEYAILSEMDADRTKEWANIIALMKQSIGQYPLSAALNDLQEYKRVGTFTAALTAMSQQAAVKNDAAKQQTNSTRGAQVPLLRINMSHVGNLVSGQSAIYSITVSNSAQVGTSGAVTMTENLPAGLTLISITGPGWTCSNTYCTRPDALAGGSSYGVITVTVNVVAAQGTPLANQATVSGGGSVSSTTSDSGTTQ